MTFRPIKTTCCMLFLYYYLINLTTLYLDAFKVNVLKKQLKMQPLFNYSKHVVELRIADREYSKAPGVYIPASGVIISRRHILTAAHLIMRGNILKVYAYHDNCGKLKINLKYGETENRFKKKPPNFDIAILLASGDIINSCANFQLKEVRLPKGRKTYKIGGRAVLVAHEYFYENFYFTSKRTKSVKTTTTKYDPRYYSSEYYSSSSVSEEEHCCSTPRTLRLLRRKLTENVIKILNCPTNTADHLFCYYEQNMTIPHEGDIGTGIIDNRGCVIGILSHQNYVTYGSNINFIVDVGAFLPWINDIMPQLLELDGKDKAINNTFLRILSSPSK